MAAFPPRSDFDTSAGFAANPFPVGAQATSPSGSGGSVGWMNVGSGASGFADGGYGSAFGAAPTAPFGGAAGGQAWSPSPAWTTTTPVSGSMASGTSSGFAASSDPWASAPGAGGGSGGAASVNGAEGLLYDPDDMEREPPLLDELGINFGHIMQKMLAVVHPTRPFDESLMEDADMAGPVFVCLALGFFLLLDGVVHFGTIYGFALIGCLSLYTVLNLIARTRTIDVARVVSVFGYSLMPITAFAALKPFLLFAVLKQVVAFVCVLWCTFTATRFFEAALHMYEHRFLIAYPTFLLFASFALLAVFPSAAPAAA